MHISPSPFALWSRETGSTVPSRVSPRILHTQAESGAYSRDDSSRVPRRRPCILFEPPYVIGPVPSLSGHHAIANRWRSLPRVRWWYRSSSQGSSSKGCCFFRRSCHGSNNVHLPFSTSTTIIYYRYQRMDQPGIRLPILLVVSRTGEMTISLSPFAPENLVSRDGFGSPVPCQFAHSP